MQVKSIAECSKHSAILSTFIKLPFVFKIFLLSIFEWPFKTGFTVVTDISTIIILSTLIVSGAVLVSGVFDLRPIVNTYINDALKMKE